MRDSEREYARIQVFVDEKKDFSAIFSVKALEILELSMVDCVH